MKTGKIFSYWSGPATWMERLSCASAVAAGHDVTVFSYSPHALRAADLGVRVEDAREVFDAADLGQIHDRAPDHFSDWFRVEGLAQGLGTWFDLDLLFLRSLGDEALLMGWERPKSVCNAVLGLSSDEPLLHSYLAFCRRRPVSYAPPWYPLHTRINMQWKRVEKWVTGKKPPRLHCGPAALTHFVLRHRLESKVLPQEVFYPFSPIQLDDMRVLVDGERIASYIGGSTRAVHLWRSLYKRVNGLDLPPRDCWLGHRVREFDVAAERVPLAG